jgi:DNA-binding NarL/FixJ family response regulator
MVTSGQAGPASIRVLIVDDHAVVREGIAALLGRQPDMMAVGEASDGDEAVALFRELAPDVTLMDIQLGRMGGIEAIEQIRRTSPDARILVLTTYPGDAQVVRAIRAGAAGYLLKNCIRKELLDAIRAVHAGGRVLSPDVAHDLAMHALDEPLSNRELTVLRLVANGHPNKQIASQLELSTDTIKAHLKSIFAKLGVTDRTEAVTVAARRGFIQR